MNEKLCNKSGNISLLVFYVLVANLRASDEWRGGGGL